MQVPLTGRKLILAGGVALALVLVGIFFLLTQRKEIPQPVQEAPTTSSAQTSVLGRSAGGHAIEVTTYGTGPRRILFVGGIHGGYEWNSVLLAYQVMDYLAEHPDSVPSSVSVSIIPNANPDGLIAVTGKEGRFTAADASTDATVLAAGRFNANNVDLNRNFSCHWQPESTWRNTPVSAGTAPFSEPEAKVVRDFVLATDPVAVIFWHSQGNAVYASECDEGVLLGTLALMNAYATAAKYQAIESFTAYPITGDAEGWLASIGIPAITVELSSHTTTEWEKNLAGVTALFKLYGE
ncbi:hypothetical protein KKD95_02980 [Patescibacteria group bacterium]|nr:hypothetical protein [Patescibacteria group bacterium]